MSTNSQKVTTTYRLYVNNPYALLTLLHGYKLWRFFLFVKLGFLHSHSSCSRWIEWIMSYNYVTLQPIQLSKVLHHFSMPTGVSRWSPPASHRSPVDCNFSTALDHGLSRTMLWGVWFTARITLACRWRHAWRGAARDWQVLDVCATSLPAANRVQWDVTALFTGR